MTSTKCATCHGDGRVGSTEEDAMDCEECNGLGYTCDTCGCPCDADHCEECAKDEPQQEPDRVKEMIERDMD
jgi:hypothetical protein